MSTTEHRGAIAPPPGTALPRPRFTGGTDIAIKIPRYRFDETVAFYRDVVGLPHLGREGDSESFRFGEIRLWLDRVDHQSQTDVWLELFTDDPDAAFAYLQQRGVPAREEVEPLDDDAGHWVSDPAGVILIVRRPNGPSDEPSTACVWGVLTSSPR